MALANAWVFLKDKNLKNPDGWDFNKPLQGPGKGPYDINEEDVDHSWHRRCPTCGKRGFGGDGGGGPPPFPKPPPDPPRPPPWGEVPQPQPWPFPRPGDTDEPQSDYDKWRKLKEREEKLKTMMGTPEEIADAQRRVMLGQ